MKKLILVVGILTQSFFGFSQFSGVKIIKSQPVCTYDYCTYKNMVVSLTHDDNYIYGLKTYPNELIYIYNPKTLEIIDSLKINLPRVVSDIAMQTQCARGLTYDGKYLWVAYTAKEKIYKIDKHTGKILGSIPGPPMPKMGFRRYDGIDFDGKYFWLIRSGDSNVELFKLKKSGKILGKKKIDSTFSLGMHYNNKCFWTCIHDMFGKKTRGIYIKKYSISDLKFVESYEMRPYFGDGLPNDITIFRNKMYIVTTGTMNISRVKLVKE
jgi:hypothetical protein